MNYFGFEESEFLENKIFSVLCELQENVKQTSNEKLVSVHQVQNKYMLFKGESQVSIYSSHLTIHRTLGLVNHKYMLFFYISNISTIQTRELTCS